MVDLNNAIKNAIERGGTLEEVKQSFLNAGYTKEEIETAGYKIGQTVTASQSVSQKTNSSAMSPEPIKKLENYQIKPVEKANNMMVLALIILSVMVAIGGVSFVLFSLLK